ncbi:nucleotidyltransferase family protein [Enterovibrio norvegicus]|uniref:nucleotidyltransferase family protein n=1 Tax=Enterovibrio norvegicus TaxID=188144 RepID=UPI00321FAA0E
MGEFRLFAKKRVKLIPEDALRVKAINCVHNRNLAHCFLPAGFVRNLVWDHLHQEAVPTPLNNECRVGEIDKIMRCYTQTTSR